MIHQNLTDLIGNTPLLEICGIRDQKARIVLKIEGFNPGGSSKDRAALKMILDAEKSGVLKPGSTIIEPTSGNTGVALAWIGVTRGYAVILTMPDTMSLERRNLLAAYGASLELTPGSEGMSGSIRRAEELRDSISGAVILSQFDNPSNPASHELSTGEEIWTQTDGMVDILVACVGTGGTLCGTARCLKRHRHSIRAVAVEPATSRVLSGAQAGKHGIQGIGANFVPGNYDAEAVDEIVAVSDEDAFASARYLSREQGLLVGISSGAAFHAACELARKDENAGRMIVAILPDSGERYLSTGIYSE